MSILLHISGRHSFGFIRRQFCSMGAVELEISRILTEKLQPTKLDVKDTSGGCGAMYDIQIESPLFKVFHFHHSSRLLSSSFALPVL